MTYDYDYIKNNAIIMDEYETDKINLTVHYSSFQALAQIIVKHTAYNYIGFREYYKEGFDWQPTLEIIYYDTVSFQTIEHIYKIIQTWQKQYNQQIINDFKDDVCYKCNSYIEICIRISASWEEEKRSRLIEDFFTIAHDEK